MKTMKFLKFTGSLLLAAGLFLSAPASAQDKEHKKIQDAATVVADFSELLLFRK
jgi:hypothetical protein